ncbi:MAG: FtsQ-type POTRA domain-containing protein [Chlorobiaceae bacterium]|nr:FtsQ-type POTRA domain-containing protein [Chlorobiaceae bacterium]NTV59957.1 FtsQ-type POTRA domain-containing protein [Chlorobiaceae bacterium]
MPDRGFDPEEGSSVPGLPDNPAFGRDGAPARHSGGWKLLFLVFILVAGALGGLAYFAGKWKQEVEVREILVDGATLVPAGDIANALKSWRGRYMQEIDTDELRRRVLHFPYVSDALLQKEMNGVLRVRLSERVPIARTILYGKILYIDREGILLPENSRIRAFYPMLPSVSGISRVRNMPNGLQCIDREQARLIEDFFSALGETEYASLLISEFHLADNNMSYCLTHQAPARFILGNDGNFKEKLKKFEIFWQKVVSKKGFDVYLAVDLRFRERVFTTDTVAVKVPLQVSP